MSGQQPSPPDRQPDEALPGSHQGEPQGEVDPIPPEQADAILEEVLEPYLADEWIIINQSPYAVRITRGMHNLDIRVDLLGEVIIEDAGLTPLQETGRLTAWVLLLTMLLLSLAIGTAFGLI